MSEPSIQQQIQQAMQLQASGRSADAEKVWREVFERDPNNTMVLRTLGSILGQSGRTHEAVELLGRCVLLDPTDAAAHTMLGASLISLKKYEKAMEHLKRAVEL